MWHLLLTIKVNGYLTVRASTITIVVSALIAVLLVVQESNVLFGQKLKTAHVNKGRTSYILYVSLLANRVGCTKEFTN